MNIFLTSHIFTLTSHILNDNFSDLAHWIIGDLDLARPRPTSQIENHDLAHPFRGLINLDEKFQVAITYTFQSEMSGNVWKTKYEAPEGVREVTVFNLRGRARSGEVEVTKN